MNAAFPAMSLWFTGSYTIALAGLDPLSIDYELIAEKMKIESVRTDLESVGIDSPESLLGLYLMNDKEIDRYAGEGVLNTDDLAYLEHSASRCFSWETTPENLSTLLRYRKPPEGLPVSKTLDDYFSAREKLVLGRIATYQGNFERARRFYEYALTITPSDRLSAMFLNDIVGILASAVTTHGDRLSAKGQIESALLAYHEALAIDPGEPGAHYGIGLIDLSQGKYSQALGRFDRAIEVRKRDARFRAGRAYALIGLGMLQEAEQEIEEIELLEIGMEKHYSNELEKLLRDTKGKGI
jgi:tetratricopeptide (TPR) repeat protein